MVTSNPIQRPRIRARARARAHKSLDLARKDAIAKGFSLGKGASRDNARLWDVHALARGSFKILQQRAAAKQGGEAIAADGPVVCEGREADDPGSGTELVEERVDDE